MSRGADRASHGDRASSQPRGHAARASLLTGAGLLLPLVVAILLLPLLARELGAARFGLFVLAWTLLDYLGFADLGFARATTRYVAADLARGHIRAVRQRIALTVAAQAALGIAVAGAMFLLAEPITARLLRAPAELLTEGIQLTRSAAPHVPVLMLMAGLRSTLEGAQRYGVSAALRGPTGALAVGAAAVAAASGAALPKVMYVVLLVRLLGLTAHAAAVARCIPEFRWERPKRWARLRRMLGFGGWVAVSSLLSPILLYAERFILAVIAGPAAAGRYALPHEALHRLLLVPAAIAGAVMPILTGLEASGQKREAQRLMASAARHTLLLLGPPVLLVIAFAPTLLAAWLGETAADLVLVARIVAAGVLCNALAHAPYAALLATNRPDIPARAHVIELLLYLPLAVVLVRTFGVAGAAAAWTLRVLVDSAILGVAARRLAGAPSPLGTTGRASLLLFAGLAAVMLVATVVPVPLGFAITVLALSAYLAGSWYVALLPEERDFVRRAFGSMTAMATLR